MILLVFVIATSDYDHDRLSPIPGLRANALTGNVPKAFTFTGTAKNRAPVSGSAANPHKCSYLAERMSPEIAARWYEEVMATLRRVEKQPDLGRLRRDLAPTGIRSLNGRRYPRYLLFYGWQEETIEILRINTRHDGPATTVRRIRSGIVTAVAPGPKESRKILLAGLRRGEGCENGSKEKKTS